MLESGRSVGETKRHDGERWTKCSVNKWKFVYTIKGRINDGPGSTTSAESQSWNGVVLVNGRDLASMCVLCPRLEEQVSLNFRRTELRSEDGLDCGVSYD